MQKPDFGQRIDRISFGGTINLQSCLRGTIGFVLFGDVKLEEEIKGGIKEEISISNVRLIGNQFEIGRKLFPSGLKQRFVYFITGILMETINTLGVLRVRTHSCTL